MTAQIVKQFQSSHLYGKYKSIYQKFKSQFQRLSEDPNVQRRWIWELIQNAKDLSNQFEKVKIKMVLNNTEFKFMHNGDPFTPAQIQSLISQFSQKDQREDNVTGKYGTGFITGYMLSRYLKIQGILSPSQVDKYSNNLQNIKNIQNSTTSKLSKKQLKQIKTTQKQNQKKQLIKEQSLKPKESQTQFYYPFQIKLDRHFDGNKEQNINKLLNTQLSFGNYLKNSLIPKEKWKRNQNQFNTTFTYQKLQNKSFVMIKKAIESVMQLFGYALLFNDKLYSIEFLDERKEGKIPNFKIEKNTLSRKSAQLIYHIPIFSFKKILQQKQSQHFLAFKQEDARIVALPINILSKLDSPKFQLLQINKNLPKIFKQFPLIGCQDTGFNFVFTSKSFEPKQNRKQLILQTNKLGDICENQKLFDEKVKKQANDEDEEIENDKVKQEDEDIQLKVQKNWRQVRRMFQMTLKLTKKIGEYTYSGIQNLLIMTNNNFLTQQNPQFSEILDKFIKATLSFKIIEMKDGSYQSFQDINLITIINDPKYLEISKQLNQIFYFLFGQDKILSSRLYQMLYEKLTQRKTIYQDSIKYMDLKTCLKIISQLQGFDSFEQLLKPGEGIKKLKQIYLFLAKHQPTYLDFNKLGLRQNISISRLKIFLNNNLKLVAFEQKNPLKIKINVPIGYEQIANYLEIDFNQSIMHEELADIIQNYGDQHIFDGDSMMNLFINYFQFKDFTPLSIDRIRQLCAFLKVFNKSSELLNTIQSFKVFHNIEQIKISRFDFKQLSKEFLEYFEKILKISFVTHINTLIIQGQKIEIFSRNNLVGRYEQPNLFKLLNQLYKISRQCKIEIELKVNQNKAFTHQTKLRYLKINEQLSAQDYNIYLKFIGSHLLRTRSTQLPLNIRQILLNSQIQNRQKITQLNFASYFSFLTQAFNYQTPQSKKQILNYMVDINQNYHKLKTPFWKTKYDVFKNIIEKRHESIIAYSDFKKQEKDFIYRIVKSKEQLQNFVKLSKLDKSQNILQRQQQHKINLERMRSRSKLEEGREMIQNQPEEPEQQEMEDGQKNKNKMKMDKGQD